MPDVRPDVDGEVLEKALRALNEVMCYYNAQVTEFVAEAWAECMAQYGPRNVQNFLLQHMRTQKFRPTFADLDAYMGRFAGADYAFELVAQQVRRVGPHRSPDFAERPEIAHAIADMGGWAKLCEVMPDPQADRFGYESLQKRFALHYQAARSLMLRNELPVIALRGLHAIGNVPSLLNDPTRARIGLTRAASPGQGRRE